MWAFRNLRIRPFKFQYCSFLKSQILDRVFFHKSCHHIHSRNKNESLGKIWLYGSLCTVLRTSLVQFGFYSTCSISGRVVWSAEVAVLKDASWSEFWILHLIWKWTSPALASLGLSRTPIYRYRVSLFFIMICTSRFRATAHLGI